MTGQKRSFFLWLCLSHSFAGCLSQSHLISAFLPEEEEEDLATTDRFPWMVSLQDSQYTHLTFGCILSEFWIISIASCFQNRKKILALVGITNMNARKRTQPEYPITAILSHEGFNYITKENNIALLKTDTAMEFNDYVQPVCFPSRSLAQGNLENCWVSGWILTTTRKRMEMGVLRKLPVQEMHPCYLKKPQGTACYSSRKEDSTFGCLGEPGNPVICQAKETSLWVLNGILNEGGMTCTGPFLYTKLFYYSDWISQKITGKKAGSCTVFKWQMMPSAATKLEIQDTLGEPSQDLSFLPLRKDQPIVQKERAKQMKNTTTSKRKHYHESQKMESEEDKIERASLSETPEPIYYDYYHGEVMPVSGQSRLCQPWEMISAFCLLALLFGDIWSGSYRPTGDPSKAISSEFNVYRLSYSV